MRYAGSACADLLAAVDGAEAGIPIYQDFAGAEEKEIVKEVENWEDIVAIAAGDYHAVGLHSDGTVVAYGIYGSGECDVNEWEDVVAIAADGWMTTGLKSDGTVYIATNWTESMNWIKNAEKWNNIIAVDVGQNYAVGLRSDGTVCVVYDSYVGDCFNIGEVEEWKDIVYVSCYNFSILGITKDGDVLYVGDKDELREAVDSLHR